MGELEFEIVGEFLVEIKKKFRRGEEESVKAAELRRIEQGGRTIEEFVQEFKRVVRRSGYEEQLLVEEFKREISGAISGGQELTGLYQAVVQKNNSLRWELERE